MNVVARKEIPRLPLDGMLDLTYRCNNRCRHCWLWLPANAAEARDELSFEEIVRIVGEARGMGCQSWSISGGEPLLRPDFIEIFDYLTHRAVHYKLNTNGTLITPQIARLLVRRGEKMVAIYGATAEIHDRVTRSPGSFDATMQGIAYLKEAGAVFTVQVIPMRTNYHQYDAMLELARTLSPHYRLGAPWIFLSACGSTGRNRQIAGERLTPAEVISLNEPVPNMQLAVAETQGGGASEAHPCAGRPADDRLFAACIAGRREFHVDPYGQMSFCPFIKEPGLRYDLRQGAFRQAWDEFIPSLAELVLGGQEYLDNCGSCELREDCRWCGVYGYLEHRRFSARVDYLCQVAQEARRFKEDWKLEHLRYYEIAGITIQVSASFPIDDHTFAEKFGGFRVDRPGPDTIALRLESAAPAAAELRLGQEIYRKPPWAIYRQARSWAYVQISPDRKDEEPQSVAVFDLDHRQGTIYRRQDAFNGGALESLTTFPSDQILLARVLADRQGCYMHAGGISVDGKGLLFVGHSEAGKSTILKMLRDHGEILCDDRIIVRRWPEGFRIHGTWSHGELPDVSPAGAPLRAIMYLEKAPDNQLIPILDTRERLARMLSYVIKPLATPDWWEKTLELAGTIAAEVPAYRLRFDKSGAVVDLLKQL